MTPEEAEKYLLTPVDLRPKPSMFEDYNEALVKIFEGFKPLEDFHVVPKTPKTPLQSFAEQVWKDGHSSLSGELRSILKAMKLYSDGD